MKLQSKRSCLCRLSYTTSIKFNNKHSIVPAYPRKNPELEWTNVRPKVLGHFHFAKALDGLNGTMYAPVNDSEHPSIVGDICKNAHPDFRLELISAAHGITVSELEKYPPILERLAGLSLKTQKI